MKLVRVTPGRLVFQIASLEKRLLTSLLKLYPLMPSGHYRLSKTSDASELAEDQKLLDEALDAQRKLNRTRLGRWVRDKRRFKRQKTGFVFKLTRLQFEWLVQVLNDIRVGSWIRLGAPDYEAETQLQVTRENVQFVWAREVSGALQMALLAGLNERP